ncbi:MAG: hypothetical protein RMJ87_10080 [Cytophagales bacterium]|nr:hypothetical protein [Bernardetiaceae bacterium]MDW8205366.1 hypothetical protein [Cytophagales bacterium]
MKTSVLFCLLFLYSSLHAQQPSAVNTTPPSGINAQQNLDALGSPVTSGSNVVLSFDTRYRGFLNSPYLFDAWTKGELLFKNGTKYSDIDMKLNTYNDELMVRKRDTGDSIVVDKTAIQQFSLTDSKGKTMLFRKLSEPETKQAVFFQVLHEGNQYTLLAHHKKTILQADYKGAYSAGRYYDEFLPSVNYYLVTNQSPEWVKLKTQEKALLKTLNDQTGSLKNYIRENRLNPSKNQEDLVQLVKKADELAN